MADLKTKFSEYRPTKNVWFWSCAGVSVLTMVIGFTFGGWVTGGTAQDRAESQSEEAVASLAATICVERFLAAPDARVNMAALKEESSFSRDDFISDGGWVTFGDSGDPIDQGADLCADQLAEMELPAAPEPAAVEAEAPDDALPDEAMGQQDDV